MNIQFPDFITAADIEEAKTRSLLIYEQSGSKIEAIKYIRANLCCGLREALDFLEMQIGAAAFKRSLALREAAPDLLAALTALLAKVECGTALNCPLCDAARAAIAKATQP